MNGFRDLGQSRICYAEETPDASALPPVAAPVAGDMAWHPLRQHWLGDEPDRLFQPGWTRVRWTPSALIYDLVFAGANQRNRARRLNEPTWDLGDVGEIFLQAEGRTDYLEIHVTPENRRLQLHFPADGIAAVRAGRARLGDFMIADPAWVASTVTSFESDIRIRVIVPAAILGAGGRPLSAGLRFRTAVCRYDYGPRPADPILSSTAALSAPAFHQPSEWSLLQLAPAAATVSA